MNKQPKKVLLIGGTKGIGLALASTLAGRGYNVLATYGNDHDAATQAAQQITKEHPQGLFTTLPTDIADPNSATQLYQYLAEQQWWPQVVIFNAGLTFRGSIASIPDTEWLRVFEGNVHFPFRLVKLLLPHLPKGSAILFTGSLMALHPHSMSMAYGVTKSAVHAMVRNLVKELEPYQIRVAGIAPGFVDTEWQKSKPHHIRQSIEAKVAQHRFASAQEVANAYLALIENDYFNGDILTLSGGYNYQ